MESEIKFPTLADALNSALDAPDVPSEDAPSSVETASESVIEGNSITNETGESQPEIATPESEPVTAITAPEHWSSEDRSKFEKLTDEGRNLVLNWEKQFKTDYTKKTEELADIRKSFDPYREKLRLQGVSEAQAIQQLLAAQAYLDRDPVQALKWLMKSYNVESQFQNPAAPEEEFVDPQVAALRKELAELKGQVTTQSTAQQQAQMSQAQKLLDDFKSAKDGESLKHPHFERLKPRMSALMRAEPSLSLEDAYGQALWADPQLRVQSIEVERQKALKDAEAKAEADRKAKVSQAKKAAAKPNGKAGDVMSANKDLRSILDEAMRQHGV